MRQKRVQQTMLERHGVINAGQLPGGGFGTRNNIPYKKPKVSEDYLKYRKQVDQQTPKTVAKIKKEGRLPDTCYYTGVRFADAELDVVNPNDPLKKTVDHRIPVSAGFFTGMTVSEVCSETNVVFCLKIVNTLKHNDTEESFRKSILPGLTKRLTDEI